MINISKNGTITALCSPPKVMLRSEFRNERSTALRELAAVKGKVDYDRMMKSIDEIHRSLHHHLPGERSRTEKRLEHTWKVDRKEARQRFRRLWSRIHRTKVTIKRHKEYGDALIVVDYKKGFDKDFFFDETFVDGGDYPHGAVNRLAAYKRDLIDKNGSVVSMKGKKGCMHFVSDSQARMDNTNRYCGPSKISWPCESWLWDEFTKLNKTILTELGMDEHQELDLLDTAGFLHTVREQPQWPHLDFKQQEILSRLALKMGTNIDQLDELPAINKGDLPYSFDMPLTSAGLRLQVFGLASSPKFTTRIPFPLRVEFQQGAFWRGDVIHGGSLWGINHGSAFRMHSYIPFNDEQAWMGKTHSPEIEWRWWCQTNLKVHFKDIYGQDFK